jgi:hypothetical protein
MYIVQQVDQLNILILNLSKGLFKFMMTILGAYCFLDVSFTFISVYVI